MINWFMISYDQHSFIQHIFKGLPNMLDDVLEEFDSVLRY